MVNIASGLNHSKEMRDLFLDIVEKIVEPCKQIKLNKMDMELLLHLYTDDALCVEPFNA